MTPFYEQKTGMEQTLYPQPILNATNVSELKMLLYTSIIDGYRYLLLCFEIY